MKVSLNTIKQYIDVDLSVDELVQKINQQLGGVEQVVDLGVRYKDAIIVKVVSAIQHPNADRLKVTKIDDGGARQGVERDENGYVQVVCGAPNAHEGMFAVWLPPESTVPASFDEKELFVLGSRELRGEMSHGMLAASDELAIGSDHSGILEIDPTEWKPNNTEIKPGTSFAKAYGLDDTIIDIENKMFTHRPDLFGQLGVAREIAGISHKQFVSPQWYVSLPQFESSDGLELEVFNDANDKVPRFMAVAMKSVEVKPSPLWLQVELTRLGSKPKNNIVDVTNYIMLLTAQPVHAYDYDKLRGHKLGARMAKVGEKATLLNGKVYELHEDDIVIADGEGVIGLGGVMGGGNSEVSEETKNIVLEVATFDMYAVRKTSMRHGIFTDAVTRFNKGQSPLQNDRILNLLMMSIKDVSSDVEQASNVSDATNEKLRHLYDDQSLNDKLKINVNFINKRLGLSLSSDDIERLLRNVECDCSTEGKESETVTSFTAPFWRTDIELPEDIVEEVGRLYGFDKLPRELPQRRIAPMAHNPTQVAKQKIRESLARAGANELLTYSFVHENVIKKAEQDVSQAFRLSNALSPDLQYYRLSVLPSLLDKIHANIKAGYDEFALFEIGKGHNKSFHNDDDNGLPGELKFVDIVYTSKEPRDGAAYYRIKRLVGQLSSDLGSELIYKPITKQYDYPVTAPFDQSHSALIETTSGIFVGIVGELKRSVIRNFKLPTYSAAASLDFSGLQQMSEEKIAKYVPLSRYPSADRDVCFQVDESIKYHEVLVAMEKFQQTANIHIDVEPIDIFQPSDSKKRNITLRFTLTSYDRTLDSDEISKITEDIIQTVTNKTDATVI